MPTEVIAPADCKSMRESVRNGATFAEVAEQFGVIYDTVQYHVRDECCHEVDVDPVPF